MRRIRGTNGRVHAVSDSIASGMVASGRAEYVEDAPAPRRRNGGRSKAKPAPVEQQETEDSIDAGSAGNPD